MPLFFFFPAKLISFFMVSNINSLKFFFFFNVHNNNSIQLISAIKVWVILAYPFFLGGTIPTSRQSTISGQQNITFDSTILTLCSTNITYNCTFVTFSDFLILFSHLKVSSSHYAVLTSYVTILLSHSVIPMRDRAPDPFYDVEPNPREWVELCYCLSK